MNLVPQPSLLTVDWWALGAVIALSVGCMRSSSGWGVKPIQKMSSRSGANTSRSRNDRSASRSFSWCVTGPNITRMNIHSM